jgi:hypothetical protein
MINFRSIVTMTLVAACIAAPFLAQTVFASRFIAFDILP